MRALALTVALGAPQLVAAQDQALFETALAECARYVMAQPDGDWNFQTPPATIQTDEAGTDASVVYPAGSGGGFDFAVTYTYDKGTSTAPGAWNCAGAGPKAPQWEQFGITGWIGADARLRAAGLVELKFPPPQRAYANCTAESQNVYLLFNAGDGDRVVFAATTGPVAAAFCSSMGWKG